ncbi:MAG TPA: hypothetical protein VKC60_01770, partial [Opitutaceae bacterium]|nr:hypothetical protein [Opitutaceae bacterium]
VEQKKNPAFTLVGNDRIHPGPIGHFVMAYAFLKAQALPRFVAQISLSSTGKIIQSENCTISRVTTSATGIEFDCREQALPLVVPDDAKPALQLVPFIEDFDQEPLQISGLADGTYVLKIDNQVVGEYAAADLAKGINLAENPKTPEYAQGAQATKINTERTRLAARWRDIVAQVYSMSRAKIDVLDPTSLAKAIEEKEEQATKAGKPLDARLQAIKQELAGPGMIEKDYAVLSAELVRACQPIGHHFALAKK